MIQGGRNLKRITYSTISLLMFPSSSSYLQVKSVRDSLQNFKDFTEKRFKGQTDRISAITDRISSNKNSNDYKIDGTLIVYKVAFYIDTKNSQRYMNLRAFVLVFSNSNVC